MMNKVILYGAGKDGIAALKFLGKDKILFFCDDNKSNLETIEEIRVKSFSDMMKSYGGELILITASTAKNVYDITEQLAKVNANYTLFDYYAENIIREDGKKYNLLNRYRNTFQYERENEFIISRDKGKNAGKLGNYFWQDLWAAKHIYENKPVLHFDIGSRVDGFIAHLLSFGQRVRQIDIRPMKSDIDGWEFMQSDATLLEEIQDESIASLSALCSLEHFGLGRYGDDIDPEACFKCFKAIQKKLEPGGRAYISVPVSLDEHLEFNAHRIFHPNTIIEEFCDLRLVEFSTIYKDKIFYNANIYDFDNDVAEGGRLVGLFRFVK